MMHKDQVLIAGIIEGNEKILTHFYKENAAYVQGYILHNYGNPEDVEDIFQDALVVLYQKLGSDLFELRGSLKVYFFGICKNLWRARLRKMDRLIIDDGQNRFEEGTIDSLPTDLEDQERQYLYKKYFHKLSSDKKKLLYLFFEGRSIKEISEITGYTEGYTRKKKFEAKKQLIHMIEKDPMYKELRAVC